MSWIARILIDGTDQQTLTQQRARPIRDEPRQLVACGSVLQNIAYGKDATRRRLSARRSGPMPTIYPAARRLRCAGRG
ncbi:MAG: hypothetical protein ACLUVV_02380 [Christensenellales bacterium]